MMYVYTAVSTNEARTGKKTHGARLSACRNEDIIETSIVRDVRRYVRE